MVGVTSLAGARIYIDANIAIYSVEKLSNFAPPHRALLSSVDRGEIELVTSELTTHECLVKPFASDDQSLADDYMQFPSTGSGMTMIALERRILVLAARLRATLKLKAADAIHVATAVDSNCTHFLTNDDRIRAPIGLTIVRWRDIEA